MELKAGEVRIVHCTLYMYLQNPTPMYTMYPHTAHCFGELVLSVVHVIFILSHLYFLYLSDLLHWCTERPVHITIISLYLLLIAHFLFVSCSTSCSCYSVLPVALLQTLPFIVSSDIQRMQISVISKSFWSKVFSFEKSHATVLYLRGAVSIRVS